MCWPTFVIKFQNQIDMQKVNAKLLLLLMGWIMLLPIVCYKASASCMFEGNHPIQIHENDVQHIPKGSTIQASIDGHTLTVVFTENIGLVEIDITTAEGLSVYYTMRNTPNGIIYNIPDTGDFVVTFTLENGDEYYGEFTITD